MADDNGHAYTKATELEKNCGKIVTALGYFTDHKRVTTVKGEKMAFCTFLDVNLNWIDTFHFPDFPGYYDLKGRGERLFLILECTVLKYRKCKRLDTKKGSMQICRGSILKMMVKY